MASSFVLILSSVVSLYQETLVVHSLHLNLSALSICGSAFVFVLSVAAWRVDWKRTASRHGGGRKEYAVIKSALRQAIANPSGVGDREAEGLLRDYNDVGIRVVAIPDRLFIALKHAHLRKVYVSRLLDRHPYAVRWVIEVQAYYRHSKNALDHEDN
jgi:hypothetical protein